MIKIDRDKLFTFAQLAKMLPARRNGRPVHVATIHRWRHPGLRGVKLRAIRIGGGWATTITAFNEFCEALAARCDPASEPVAKSIGNDSHEQAEQELESSGWVGK